MKQFLQILIFLCVSTITHAQNSTEAKMAYQMAEEKFDAKQYTEALDYLEKAEKALGSTNPPMLFLKVMITNQIVTANESMDNYQKLEKAIGAFDKHKNKNALGEDKQMEVYRIKMDLDKRKAAYEKEANRIADLKRQYDEMVYRLAGEFPKTETTVRDFMDQIPSSWPEPRRGQSNQKVLKDKHFDMFVKWGSVSFNTYEIGKIYLQQINTHAPGEDCIKDYIVFKKIDYDCMHSIKRNLTIEEICEVLNITPQQWSDFTLGAKPLIKKNNDPDGYLIVLKSNEKRPDGEHKEFQIYMYEKTRWYGCEGMQIAVFKNTF